jgi:hypothetical protein
MDAGKEELLAALHKNESSEWRCELDVCPYNVAYLWRERWTEEARVNVSNHRLLQGYSVWREMGTA